MDRRDFLRNVSVMGVTVPVLSRHSVTYSQATISNDKLTSLSYFLDTLIPEDDTPSASQIGIPIQLIEYARNIQNYTKLLEWGCMWLDEKSQQFNAISFAEIDQSLKNQIVELAERSPESTIPKLFFEHVRKDAFHLYYSDPRSWAGLGMELPPQPLGYLDHTLPPARPVENN